MRFSRHLLRIYSYIVEALLSLISLAMSAVIYGSPHQTIHLGWLPWPEDAIGPWLAGIGVAGILIVILAVAGRLRFLLTIFALATFVLIGRGLFLTGWHFNGEAEFRSALWVVGGLFLAFLGSIPMGSAHSGGGRR